MNCTICFKSTGKRKLVARREFTGYLAAHRYEEFKRKLRQIPEIPENNAVERTSSSVVIASRTIQDLAFRQEPLANMVIDDDIEMEYFQEEAGRDNDDETTATIEAEEPFDEAESWAKQDLLRIGTSEMTGEPIHLDIEDSGRVAGHTKSEKRIKELYILMQNYQVQKSAKDAIIKWINKIYLPNQSKDESLKSV
ncbi:uncharacterized protein BX663DRAFT_544451 [Cokeromyces recurvatus]|uniref:uncharacterized protein n=1 Tax=Cokeromyces recurvatus TaxID=90255 RepID=UPI00222084A4|nr:uncharacterized protein BX663DRAFT_544451 [Cokeromyces recurvatus]KAI7900894.1 hypothetical protein BX663DRAFT_544451 [Cokeromyces recurvatus]